MSEQPIEVHLNRWNNDSLALLCGIANAGGGHVVVRATDKDYTMGFRRMKRPFEAIPQLSQQELGINCTTEPVMDGSTICLEVTVPSAEKPVSYLGDYWLYGDQGNQLLDRAAIEQAMANAGSAPWELWPQPLAQEQDINAEELLAIATIPLGDLRASGKTLEDNIEERLNLLHLKDERTGILTNAGVLLLHDNPSRFIPGATVRIGLFEGRQPEHRMHTEVTGPLRQQLQESLRLIYEEYLPAISTSRAFTSHVPPREALHEALANALVHKDYESGVPVQVRVYPDRIVVENAGRPPAEWSTDDLTSHHAPRPSNMILAYVMRMNGIVHGWGDGFDLMRQSCVAANAAEPLVELGVSDTLITFPLPEGKRGRDAIKPTNASTDGQIAHAAHAKGGNLAASGARAQGGRPGQSDGKNSEAPPPATRRAHHGRCWIAPAHIRRTFHCGSKPLGYDQHRRVRVARAHHQRARHCAAHCAGVECEREHGAQVAATVKGIRIHRAHRLEEGWVLERD